MPHVCAALPRVTWASALLAGELLEPAPFTAPEAWRCACSMSNCTGNTVPAGTRRSGITCGLCHHGPHRLLAHHRAPNPQPVLDSPHPAPQDTFAPIGLPPWDPGFTATPRLLWGPQGVPRPRHPSTWRQTR